MVSAYSKTVFIGRCSYSYYRDKSLLVGNSILKATCIFIESQAVSKKKIDKMCAVPSLGIVKPKLVLFWNGQIPGPEKWPFKCRLSCIAFPHLIWQALIWPLYVKKVQCGWFKHKFWQWDEDVMSWTTSMSRPGYSTFVSMQPWNKTNT